jgi:ketosteroid isomerase-like protein
VISPRSSTSSRPTPSGTASSAGASGSGEARPADAGPRRARSVLEGLRREFEQRPGHQGVRATEFIPVGDDRIVVGVYWVRDDCSQGEPAAFQTVRVRDGRIHEIHDYHDKNQALRKRAR